MILSLPRKRIVALRVFETVEIDYYCFIICGYVTETPVDRPVVIHESEGTRITSHARDAITLLNRAFAPATALRNQTHEVTL